MTTTASYGTQVRLLQAHEVGAFAWVIPSTIDLLAIASTMALQLPALDRTSRRIAGGILVTSVAVSVTANVPGGHNAIECAAPCLAGTGLSRWRATGEPRPCLRHSTARRRDGRGHRRC